MAGEASYPWEVHARVSNDWLEKYKNDKNAVFDCRYPDGDKRHVPTSTGRAMLPRSITIDGSTAGDDTVGIVHGYLWGENSKQADYYRLSPTLPYPMRFLAIYAKGTTARGVKVFG